MSSDPPGLKGWCGPTIAQIAAAFPKTRGASHFGPNGVPRVGSGRKMAYAGRASAIPGGAFLCTQPRTQPRKKPTFLAHFEVATDAGDRRLWWRREYHER